MKAQAMPTDQRRIFADSEGDRWFARNQASLEQCDTARDLPLRLMEMYQLQPRSVLEVGVGNGYRLAAIAKQYAARTVAVEPSADPVEDGRQRFPAVQFLRGLADRICDQRLAGDVDQGDRIAVWLLRKQLAGFHEEAVALPK